MFLPILYWIILILSILGAFAPPSWPSALRIGPSLVLFTIIGLKLFPVSL